MKINVAKVNRNEVETAHYDLEEKFLSFQIGPDILAYKEPVHVQLQVSNTGKSLLVQGKIHTNLAAVCSRCLEGFPYPIELTFEDEWVPASRATTEQQEDCFLFEGEEIEITERITEQIILALPMKFLCSNECRGLCPKCGKNLNLQQCACAEDDIDPRFAKLTQWSAEE